MRTDLVNWPHTHYLHHHGGHRRETEAEAAERERHEGNRHKVRKETPWQWERHVPGGTGSPDYPEKQTLA